MDRTRSITLKHGRNIAAAGISIMVLAAYGPVGLASPASAATSTLERPRARTMSSTLVKEIKRTVFFAPASAELNAHAKRILAAAVALIPSSATGIAVNSIGYVQPSALHGNDVSLSTMRARAVIAGLRRLGVGDTYTASGRGRATQSGPEARRAEVVISFTPSGTRISAKHGASGRSRVPASARSSPNGR